MNRNEKMNNDLIIFYADDDLDDREFFSDAIEELHNSSKLFTHEDGEKLLSALQNPPPIPSVVFIDLNMPGKTGFDVLKEIRENRNLKNIPIVVVSTSSDENTINTTRELGANYYIPKSANYGDLKKSINYALNINWQTFIPKSSDFVYSNN